MDKYFHSTLYNEYNYLSMLRLKLTHVSKMGPGVEMGMCIRNYISKYYMDIIIYPCPTVNAGLAVS